MMGQSTRGYDAAEEEHERNDHTRI
jgi:hypothetical protein